MPGVLGPKYIDEIVMKKNAVEAQLFKYIGVTGVDVGYKYVNGKMTNDVAIRVHVKKKTLAKYVPKDQLIPSTIDGVPTDVIERNYRPQSVAAPKPAKKKKHKTSSSGTTGITAAGPDAKRYTTLQGGISIGPDIITAGNMAFAGTLGAIVTDNVTNKPMMLSCSHVMLIDSLGALGDKIDQPSLCDIDSSTNGVGKVVRSSLNNVDCALATIDSRRPVRSIVDIGPVAGAGVAALKMKVRKRGRSTLLTYGIVESISSTTTINYGAATGILTFRNQVGFAPDTTHNALFSNEGDSGSAIVDDSNNIVALLYAGTGNAGGFTIGNPIGDVITAMNITI